MSGTPYERYEGIKDSVRLQLMIPARDMKYEIRENANDSTKLHTIYQSKPMKAMELSVMTEVELLTVKEFFNRAFDDALKTVRELDIAAQEKLAEGLPSKRLYRPEPKLLVFPKEGGVPDEWHPTASSSQS